MISFWLWGVFDEETGAEEDFTENCEDKVEAIVYISKAEEVFDKKITADLTAAA